MSSMCFEPAHVLREFGHAALGVVDCGDEIAGAGFAHWLELKPHGAVEVVQHIQVADLVANMHPPQRLRRIGLRIKLDKLAVVDLDEDLGDRFAVVHCK